MFIPIDNTINDSDFIDFKLLNMKPQKGIDLNLSLLDASDNKKRMSMLLDIDEGPGDERSLIMTKGISETEGILLQTMVL